MTVTSDATRERGPSSARDAILDAARFEAAAGAELSIKAVAARAGVTRQAVYYHFGGARGLRAALAAEGLAEPSPDEPTRERLVDAAVAVLSRPGGGVASVDRVAAEAGLTKGAIYHHFGDRRALFQAVARRVSPVGPLVATLDASADLPLRDGLIALAGTYYREMGARVELIRNLGANAGRDPELAQTVMAEIVGRGAPAVFAWFGRRIARGELRAIDVSFVMQALFGPMFLVVVFGRDVFEPLEALGIRPAVDNVEAYVDFLLEGIAARSGEDPPVPFVDGANPVQEVE